jgi:hypothetical protein
MFRNVAGLTMIAAFAACTGSEPALLAEDGAGHRYPSIPATAKSQDLIYVTSAPDIYVFSFPDGGYVGTIQADYPYGTCVNAAGDVFVVETTQSKVDVYAHGASMPKRSLQYPGYDPTQCAVNPSTGDLVVMSGSGAALKRGTEASSIWIYPRGKGKPKEYQVTGLDYVDYACYDADSDLFIDGTLGAGAFALVELPNGKTAFKTISLDEEILNRIRSGGGIEWTGDRLAVANDTIYTATNIDKISITGTKARFAEQTSLDDATGGIGSFWIQGRRVVAPENDNGYLWPYPKGGSPVATLQVADGEGVVVSVARK